MTSRFLVFALSAAALALCTPAAANSPVPITPSPLPSVDDFVEGMPVPDKPASVPDLMVLQFRDGQNLGRFRIKVEPGATEVPIKGVRPLQWTILPGAAIDAPAQPPNRLVELYRGTPQQSQLVCRIGVRYFRARNGLWVAHFLLIEEPLVARRGDRWVPFTAVQGDADLIILTSSTLPNADGYYPSLEFGFNGQARPIDFWVVH